MMMMMISDIDKQGIIPIHDGEIIELRRDREERFSAMENGGGEEGKRNKKMQKFKKNRRNTFR